MRVKTLLAGILCVGCLIPCCAQRNTYLYKRKISDPDSAGWYSILLPPAVIGKTDLQLSDLRILQLNPTDTLEVPYLVNIETSEVSEKEVVVKLFNKSKIGNRQFVTLELPKDEEVNALGLEFAEQNFTGSASVEGSDDRKKWYEVAGRTRILSIQNDQVDFSFTKLTFPSSRYRYLRIGFESDTVLTFNKAVLSRKEVKPGIFNRIPLVWTSATDTKNRLTILSIEFPEVQPLGSIQVDVNEKVDYYRPVQVEVLADSVKGASGWQYFYNSVFNGYLNSLEVNAFEFPVVLAKKLRLTIRNDDNPPIAIGGLSAQGPQVSLSTRLSPGENFLFYKNEKLTAPSYDLKYFEESIPDSLLQLTLMNEESIEPEVQNKNPLIVKKIWLWVVLGAVIGILGFFTIRMLKKA